jgi:hypothetical protein
MSPLVKYTQEILGVCINCDKAIRPGHSLYREVKGWEKATTNSIIERKYTGRVRCGACNMEASHPTLFEEGVTA